MTHLGMCLLVLGTGAIALAMTNSWFSRRERWYVWMCFVAHLLSSFALVLITRHYFGVGDMFAYQRMGSWLADLLRSDLHQYSVPLIDLLLHRSPELPFLMYGSASTGSMVAFTAMGLFVLGGSFYAVNLAFSLLAFSGQIAIYLAFRDHFPIEYRRRIAFAILLVPSVVFWSAGVVKEAIALTGLGWMLLPAMRFAYGLHRPRHVLLFAAGVFVVSITKPYILLPFSVGVAVAYYWRRAQAAGRALPRFRPVRLALAVALGVCGIVLIGQLFPRFALDHIAEEAARLQGAGEMIEGGSTYEMGDASQRSWAGQILYAPWALVSSLFRPFLFEVHNLASLASALESTLVLLLFLKALRARSISGAVRRVASSPPLMFCVVFVVVFGIGVGLATTNLGSLSRYRMPMIPLYVMTLVMLLRAPRPVHD